MEPHDLYPNDQHIVESATRTAKRIFGLEIEVETKAIAGAKGPGRYDFVHDRIELIPEFIDQFCRTYGNRDAVITYTICHETGHAAEARKLAEHAIFPFEGMVSNIASITVGSFCFRLNVMGELLDQFMNGILDYSVDREISNEGIPNVIAKNKLPQIKQLLTQKHSSKDNKSRAINKLNALFNLPLDIGHYEFGTLDDNEKNLIRKYYEAEGLSFKWKSAKQILQSRRFGDAIQYPITASTLCEELLGIRITTIPKSRIELLRKYRSLPDFWTKNEYLLCCFG